MAAFKVNGEYVGSYNSMTEAAEKLDVDQGVISLILKGKRVQTQGMTFIEHYDGMSIPKICVKVKTYFKARNLSLNDFVQ